MPVLHSVPSTPSEGLSESQIVRWLHLLDFPDQHHQWESKQPGMQRGSWTGLRAKASEKGGRDAMTAPGIRHLSQGYLKTRGIGCQRTKIRAFWREREAPRKVEIKDVQLTALLRLIMSGVKSMPLNLLPVLPQSPSFTQSSNSAGQASPVLPAVI